MPKLRLNLFSKVFGFAALLELIMVVIVLFSVFAFNTQKERDDFREIQSLMLEANHQRSDFSKYRDSASVSKFNQKIASIDSILLDYRDDNTISSFLLKKKDYKKIFENYENEMAKRGLDEESGIEGAFRKSVHELESKIKELDSKDMMIAMLQARRSEKDYLMRKDDKYVKKVNMAISSVIKLAESKSITPSDFASIKLLADNYLSTFSSTVEVFKKLDELETAIIEDEAEILAIVKDICLQKTIKAEQMKNIQYIAAGLSILLGLILSYIIAKGITKPVNNLQQLAKQIEAGDFSIPEKITASDEIGELYNSFTDMTSVLSGLITEVNHLTHSAAEGKLSIRGNSSKYNGGFKEIIEGLNLTMDNLLIPTNITAEYIDRISKGDVPPKIEKEFMGDFRELKNNMNTCIDAINMLIKDTDMLAGAAQTGNLSTRADASLHKGDFKKIVQGVNLALDSIVDPISEAGEILKDLSNGDLTVQMTGNYQGRMDLLKRDINSLASTFRALIKQVSTSVSTAVAGSHQIRMSTDEFLVASKETEQQTELVANSIDEMSRTLQENAQSTHQATVMAETNREIATAGFEIVGKTVNKMRDIAGLVRNSAEEIEKLGDSSKKIGEIISVIDEIADQTNLLALNAAIEAARAGEQGRGFAVVADEVRKLAERTTDATKSITNMIQGIQQETQKAVNEMVRGTSEVTIGIELADQAGDSLNKVVSSSEEVLDMINQISASNAELSATGDEIAKHVVSISKMTKDSVNSLQEIADSANNLDKLNSKTSKFMTNFKISKHNGLNMQNQDLFDDEDDYYSEQHEMIALSDGNSYEM